MTRSTDQFTPDSLPKKPRIQKLLKIINELGQRLTNRVFHGKLVIDFSYGVPTHWAVTESFKDES